MSEPESGPRALAVEPCQSLCAWVRTDELRMVDGGAEPASVFVCTGCGSQWLRSEGWTPIDADGVVPPAVAAELRGSPSPPGG